MKKKMSKKKKIVIAIAAIVILGSVFGSNEDSIKPIDTTPIVSEPVATPEEVVVEPVATPVEIEVPVYTFEKDGELLTSEKSPLVVGQEVIIEGTLTQGNSKPGQKSFAVAMNRREGTGDSEKAWGISFTSDDNLTFYKTKIGDFVRIKGTVKVISYSTLVIENCIIWK